MGEWITDNLPVLMVIFGLTIFIVLIFVALAAGSDELDAFKRACYEADGHMYWPGETGWCLSDDSTIIEIYP